MTIITRHNRVRPYAVTGGRTRARHTLTVETLISAIDYDAEYRAGLPSKMGEIYEQARTPITLTELSSMLNLTLGVVLILVSDLADQDAIRIHPSGVAAQSDIKLLEEVLSGLRKL